MASPHFVDGRYSKALPTHLLSRYQTAAADPDLLVQRAEVALIDTRLADLIDRLNDQDNRARWSTVKSAFRAYHTALEDDDGEDAESLVAGALAALERAIYAGSDDDRVWSDIGEQIEQRRKVVESERKRLVELQQAVTVAEANTLVVRLAGVIQQHVHDRSALAAISADFAAVLRTARSVPDA